MTAFARFAAAEEKLKKRARGEAEDQLDDLRFRATRNPNCKLLLLIIIVMRARARART